MIQGWCLLLWICWLSVLPGFAQIYRWTDDRGSVHYTDTPETIPPHRRASSRPLLPAAGDKATGPQPPQYSAPGVAAPRLDEAVAPSSVAQRVRQIEQQIATTLQERQRLLDQLKTVREIRTNPAFGQERRRVDEAGRALATIELQLDTLYAELRQAQAAEPAHAQTDSPTPPLSAPPDTMRDAQGRDQAYWQQRTAVLRVRLQQAREQRQAILSQLAAPAEDRSAFGRRGREVLQLVQALERTSQELRDAEGAWQALQHEANQTGAPAVWLQ